MSEITISNGPPAEWSKICTANHLLFHSTDWLDLLESSFKVRTQFLWDDDARCGAAVSSFSAGPFRLGYLGFPFGGIVGDAAITNALLKRWQSLRAGLHSIAIRVPVSAFGELTELDLSFESTLETAITDLPSWTLKAASAHHRRNVNKAMRSELEIADASNDSDGLEIFGLYSDTVERQRGVLRYNAAYFVNLIELAQSNAQIRVLVARLDRSMAGFTIAVRHGQAAFYLHGGTNLNYRQQQPSAALLYDAIRWAQGLGCTSFNLMSSPADQQSLVWYKEKWGGETREHRTYTLPLRPAYRLFKVAERIHRLLR